MGTEMASSYCVQGRAAVEFPSPPSYEDVVRTPLVHQALRQGRSACTADVLPVEMISHIMQYLDVSDRKDAALVCKRWYEASLAPQVQRDVLVSVKSSVVNPRPFTGLRNRPGFHLALSDIDGSSNSEQLVKVCETNLGSKLLTLSLKGSNVSENMLVSILSNCSNLTSLDVSCCNNLLLAGSDLARRLRGISLPALQHLDLSSMRQLSDASLTAFLHTAPNLQSLKLCSAPFLFSSSYLYADSDSRPNSAALTFNRLLLEVSKLVSTFVSLDMSRTSMSNGAIEALVTVPGLQLQSLRLASCKDITDAGIIVLAHNQHHIKELDLSSNAQLSGVTLKHVVGNMPELEKLFLSKIRLIPKEMRLLSRLTSCTKLVLSSCLLQQIALEDALLAFDVWSHRMCSIDLSYCTGLTNQVFVAMCSSMVNLTHLNIASCFRLDDVSLREISKFLVNLRSLNVAWCKHITDMGLLGIYHNEFTHDCKDECRCGKERKVAYFEYTPPVKDIAPREVVPNAHHIKSAMANHGQQGAFPITRLTSLKSLDLSVCNKITDRSITEVLAFPHLSSLDLSMCSRLTDAAVIAIANNNPALERVSLSQCRNITDRGVYALLMGCRRLSHLNIANCNLLSDNTIHTMIKVSKLRTQLKSIDVSLCNISLEAIDMLERLVPSLQTVHKRYTSTAGCP